MSNQTYQQEHTKVLGVDDEPTRSLRVQNTYQSYVPVSAETTEQQEARLAEEARIRQFQRDQRDRALGAVPVAEDDEELPAAPARVGNDRFAGSVGLFILRIVLAAFIGVRAIQVLFNISGTNTWLTAQHVPDADIIAWVLGVVLIACTLMLVFGLGTRTAALIAAALTIAVLVFVQYGYASLFTQGQAGYLGETDVLVAGIALALLFLGSGGWAIDGAMRRNRALNR